MKIPEAIRKFVDIFSGLPGIGPRQATRIAFYLIHKGSAFQVEAYRALAAFKNIKVCPECFFVHENKGGLCDICADENRNQGTIAIVEKETDLLSIENTKKFNGRYLIIGELKKTGILEADQKLRLQALKNSIRKLPAGKAEEIIIALNPNPLADLAADFLKQDLKGYAEKISRLGRGIPTGGEIEFADEQTLEEALTRRG